MSLVHEVKAGMASKRISTMAELKACLLESKPRFPEAWAWRPTDGRHERELTGMRHDGDPVGEGLENWLLLKHRQELLEWNWEVLLRFFQKLANGELSSAVERGLAMDVARRLSEDKNVNSVPKLQKFFETIMTQHERAFAWKPADGNEQEVLKQVLKHDADLLERSMVSTPGVWLSLPGVWLSLKIRLELCAFDPINR
jgi:hypothetical protein